MSERVERIACPVCGVLVTVERDPDTRAWFLALHGEWPVCDGSGRQVR